MAECQRPGEWLSLAIASIATETGRKRQEQLRRRKVLHKQFEVSFSCTSIRHLPTGSLCRNSNEIDFERFVNHFRNSARFNRQGRTIGETAAVGQVQCNCKQYTSPKPFFPHSKPTQSRRAKGAGICKSVDPCLVFRRSNYSVDPTLPS